MAPKTKKLFISYRSSDAAKVDKIARDLELLQYDDGSQRYTTWKDKRNLPPASPNWWDAIVNAIIDCDMFVFHLSRDSLGSDVCRAELDYAHRCNRPIIPVVLEGEFFLNHQSGKYDLPVETWTLVPEWLRDSQLLFNVGASFYSEFQAAVELFERNWPRDIKAPRPLNPDSKSVHSSNHALYDAACDYAQRLAFAEAEKHFAELVRRNDMDYADTAAEWIELIRLYAELMEINERRNARFIFNAKWRTYSELFPKTFLREMFDPKGFAGLEHSINAPTRSIQSPSTSVIRRPQPSRPASIDTMAAPFVWIEIPGKEYSISKYPITNAQFDVFKRDNGYQNSEWWFQAGWQEKVNENWKSPRFWYDPKWNKPSLPVVGVSWYEAVAFARWSSNKLNARTELPTEEQWIYAANGNADHAYPWGDAWNPERCNSSAGIAAWRQTSPVTQYAYSGDSPFGVVDMLGNVWEWCMEWASKKKPLRGGCWRSKTLKIQERIERRPALRTSMWGFRLVMYHR